MSVIDLVREGDEYVGWGVRGRGSRIFGGSTLGQALRAADLAIGGTRRADALHAIFVAPGDCEHPVRYRVRPLKRGRTLDVVTIEALQADRTILTAHATFHDGQTSPQFQDAPPPVPPPSALASVESALSPGGEAIRAPFDVRPAPRDDGEPQSETWIRFRGDIPAKTSNTDAALLVYAMDFLITRPAHIPLDPQRVSLFGASLDHAMWVHRPFDLTQWHLVSARATSFTGSRSHCHAQVFDARGDLVASGTQEALLPPASA